MLVQRKWMYLESIFIGSDDIRNQLPQEAKRFDTIDKAWLKIMADTAKNTNVLEACSIEGRCACNGSKLAGPEVKLPVLEWACTVADSIRQVHVIQGPAAVSWLTVRHGCALASQA